MEVHSPVPVISREVKIALGGIAFATVKETSSSMDRIVRLGFIEKTITQSDYK